MDNKQDEGQQQTREDVPRGRARYVGSNPLIGANRAETIARCFESVEYLQLSGEELHPGMQHHLVMLREALGSAR